MCDHLRIPPLDADLTNPRLDKPRLPRDVARRLAFPGCRDGPLARRPWRDACRDPRLLAVFFSTDSAGWLSMHTVSWGMTGVCSALVFMIWATTRGEHTPAVHRE